jgi:hypothetical protein
MPTVLVIGRSAHHDSKDLDQEAQSTPCTMCRLQFSVRAMKESCEWPSADANLSTV